MISTGWFQGRTHHTVHLHTHPQIASAHSLSVCEYTLQEHCLENNERIVLRFRYGMVIEIFRLVSSDYLYHSVGDRYNRQQKRAPKSPFLD